MGGLILVLALGLGGGTVAFWLVELTLRGLSRSTLTAPVVDAEPLYLIDPKHDRCGLCDPGSDQVDARLCPTCRLLIDVFADRPIPYWPEEER